MHTSHILSPTVARTWRLVVYLIERGRNYSVDLAFRDQVMLRRQVRQLESGPGRDACKLFEFKSERGEVLAFVARNLVGYDIVEEAA